MTDAENVITHLQIIRTWAAFSLERDLQFFTAKHLEDIAQWADDAVSLLEEQEEGYKNLLSDYEDLAREHERLLDKKIPLITNGQEVVRCKDCKKHDTYDCNITYLTTQKTPNDWYCAGGERLEKFDALKGSED